MVTQKMISLKLDVNQLDMLDELAARLGTNRVKLGNIYHCVDFFNNNDSPDYVMFSHLSSALDFIHSNFK